MLAVAHSNQKKMPELAGQFIDLGKIVTPVIRFLEDAGQLTFFIRLDGICCDLFFEMDELSKLVVDIDRGQPLSHPGDDIEYFRLSIFSSNGSGFRINRLL